MFSDFAAQDFSVLRVERVQGNGKRRNLEETVYFPQSERINGAGIDVKDNDRMRFETA